MSETRSYKIHCPQCRRQIDVDLLDSVNVKTDPALKERLMMNQVNAVTCPDCRLAFRVDKPLLYSDPDRRLLVYWIPVAEGHAEEGEEQFSAWLRDMGAVLPDGLRAPDIHLVFTRTELVERIFLKEAGLDERIIEYIKYLIYSKNAGRMNPAEKAVLFNAQDSTEQALRFVVQDVRTRQFEAMLEFGRDAYHALVETFGREEKTADLIELFPGPYISARAALTRDLKSEPSEQD
jgi:hypothetical protein